MADDRHYVGGDYYQLDDLSGFKIRSSVSRKIPGGQTGNLIVAPQRWETQQPQDLVRGVVDDQTVPQPRPRQENRFVILATYVVAPSPRFSYTIEVASSVGFVPGQNVFLMLDSGEQFLTSIGGISGNTIFLGTPIPATVGTFFGDPIENTLLFYNNGPPAFTGLWNDGGTLALLQGFGYPTPATVGTTPGAVYNNGLAIGIVPGGPGSGTNLFFGSVTADLLLFLGAGGLPPAASVVGGSGQLYNNGGEIAVA